MPKPKAKTIFLVDDHAVVRLGIRQLIEREPDLAVCGEAEEVRQALEGFRRTRPDLAIVDLALRGGSGLDLIRLAHKIDASLPILVLSMQDELVHAESALRAGALGYIMKSDPADLMLRAIRRVLSGKVYVSETLATRLLQRKTRGRAGPSPREDPLSDREREVLQLIGAWKTTRQIATELGLSVKTVEYYREQLKSKLCLKSGSELLQYALLRAQRQAPGSGPE